MFGTIAADCFLGITNGSGFATVRDDSEHDLLCDQAEPIRKKARLTDLFARKEALMEGQADALALTPDGITVVEKVILKARYPRLKPAMIPLTLRQEEPSDDDGVEDNTGSE